MTRRWLATVSYSYGDSHGYQIDPYRIISMVDPVTGQPTTQLYENRPDARRKQSVYLDNKVHVGGDDWGIKSFTADARYRCRFGDDYYIEPRARYYRQGAADFFRYVLIDCEVLPQYASSDTRLGQFHAQTYGVKFGWRIDQGLEFNLRLEHYGRLRQQDLFPDLKAFTVLVGYSYVF